MRAIWRVLFRALAVQFFLDHAGWLTTLAFFAGGILSADEHRTLILAALADWRVLAALYLLPWTLYALATVRFALRIWSLEPYEVLRPLRLIAPARRWLLGIGIQACMLAPLWGYAALMAAFAVNRHAWLPLATLSCWLLLLTVGSWAAHEWALRGAPQRGSSWLPTALQPRFPPHLWWLQDQLARPLRLLLLKGVSLAIVWGLCHVYAPATFDARLLTLGALLTAVVHSLIPAEVYQFERARLILLWNLPLHPVRHLLGHTMLFSLLLLPELAAWWRWYPPAAGLRWLCGVRMWAFPVSTLLLIWSCLLWRPAPPEALLARVLPAAFATYLLLMGRVALDGLTGAALLTAAGLGLRVYWRTDDVPIPLHPATPDVRRSF